MPTAAHTILTEHLERILVLAEERMRQRERMSCPLPDCFVEAIATVRREVDAGKKL